MALAHPVRARGIGNTGAVRVTHAGAEHDDRRRNGRGGWSVERADGDGGTGRRYGSKHDDDDDADVHGYDGGDGWEEKGHEKTDYADEHAGGIEDDEDDEARGDDDHDEAGGADEESDEDVADDGVRERYDRGPQESEDPSDAEPEAPPAREAPPRTRPRERASPARDGLARLGRSVGRLRVIFVDYDPSEPWRPAASEEATASGWFIRLPHEPPDSPVRYLMTCNHCVEGMSRENGVHVETASTRGDRLSARLVVAMPDIDAAIVEVLPPRDEDDDEDYEDDHEDARRADGSGSGSGDGIEGGRGNGKTGRPRFEAWELGDDRPLRIGDRVTVYGYPLGEDGLKGSESQINGWEGSRMQLDGSINFGNSGGPVVRDGRVIGWIVEGLPQANAVSFAQPISLLRAMLGAVRPPPPLGDSPPQILRRGTLGAPHFESSRDRLLAVGARSERCGRIRRRGRDGSASGGREDRCACRSGVVLQWISSRSDLRGPPFMAEPGDVLCTISVAASALGLPVPARRARGVADGAKDDEDEEEEEGEKEGGEKKDAGYHGDRPITVRVDNAGHVTPPWTDQRMELDAYLAHVAIDAPLTLSIWRSRERRRVVGPARLRTDFYRNGFFRPYRPFQRSPYEVFAGLVVSQMDADVLTAFPQLADRITHDRRERPALVVVRVFLGGPLANAAPGPAEGRSDGRVREGSVLAEVNGAPVARVSDYRAALLRPLEGRFLSIVTDTNAGDVVSMDAVMAAEAGLARQYGYPPSRVFRTLSEGSARSGGAPSSGGSPPPLASAFYTESDGPGVPFDGVAGREDFPPERRLGIDRHRERAEDRAPVRATRRRGGRPVGFRGRTAAVVAEPVPRPHGRRPGGRGRRGEG